MSRRKTVVGIGVTVLALGGILAAVFTVDINTLNKLSILLGGGK